MNKVLPTIQEIQKELNTLSEAKTLTQAQRVILSVIRLLDSSVSLDDSKQFQLFNVDNQKISANAQWFFEDNVVVDRRAIYKIHSENNLNIDFKLYGITKPSKRTISWIQALTPNFEDEPFNSKFNIGIDFVVPKSVDKVIIVLSNNYVVRTLELKGTLTATFQEILAKWASISDFNNKKEVHSILWESFDLQPLNKKFYAGISERFITLRQYLTKEKILDDKHASLFANRLLGRVIFCWFLDKKGVINPDRKYFDSHSFNDDTEYYRKNLENLFFGVLNTPVADREYKDDVTPFLNGGLFEARDTDLYKNSKLSFPKNYFDDLFDFLSGYNFTTDESTSQFQQVAIDPEMLGRIFENLLAEMTEETGEQARKAKGAFYTPREIVDYMCRESLREYLKTKIPEDQFRDQRFVQLIDAPDKDFQDQDHNWRRDWKPYKDGIIKALDDLKVLDPACGSGAFPIGMLQLLVRVYERLEPRFDTYKAKLQIVEKNIYGVDIDPMAIEISRLRAWLSIIVDEEADSKKIKPLPNLEFKFICANSLVNLDQSGITTFGDDPQLANKLQEIRDGYFNTESLNKKKKLRSDYDNLVNKGEGLFGESLRSKQLKTYRPFDSEQSSNFFNPDYMFGVQYFNIVIGNPPYVDSEMMVKNDPSFRSFANKNYVSARGNWDLFVLFIEHGINLCSENGVLSYIVPNKIVAAKYTEALRSYLLTKDIKEIRDFSRVKVFKEASVYPTVLRIMNRPHFDSVRVVIMKSISDVESENVVDQKDFYSDINWDKFFSNSSTQGLISRLSKLQSLSDYCDEISGSATVAEAYEIREVVKELEPTDKVVKYKKLINTGTIDPYVSLWGTQKTQYLKGSFMKPIVNNADIEKISKKRLHQSNSSKIIISGMTKSIEAFYDESGEYLAGKSTTIIIENEKNRQVIKYVLALLNSALISYWYKNSFQSLKLAGGYIRINPNELKKIPFTKPNDVALQRVCLLVDDIFRGYSSGNLELSKIKAVEVDDLIFDIYGIPDIERQMIRGDQ